MRSPKAHIAGIAITAGATTGAPIQELAVSAATKAMLDAGVTYSEVDQSVACFLQDLKIPPSCFNTFGMEGAPVSEVDNRSGLFAAVQFARSGESDCSLLIGLDKEASSKKFSVVAVVVVSDLFLTSHAYLKDGAICIRGYSLANRIHSRSQGGPNDPRTIKTVVQAALRQASLQPKDIQILETQQSSGNSARDALKDFKASPQKQAKLPEPFTGTTGLAGLCGLVWQLRGWAGDAPSETQNCLQFNAGTDGTASVIVLSRSDGKPALAWKDVENVRDGRERLGYNPTKETRAITQEDLEAVMAKEEFTLDDQVKRLQLPQKGGDRAALARL